MADLPTDPNQLDELLQKELAWLDERVERMSRRRREVLETHRTKIQERLQKLEELQDGEGVQRARALLTQVEQQLTETTTTPAEAPAAPPTNNNGDKPDTLPPARTEPELPEPVRRPEPQHRIPEVVDLTEYDYLTDFSRAHPDVRVPAFRPPLQRSYRFSDLRQLQMQVADLVGAAENLLNEVDHLPLDVIAGTVQALAALGRLVQDYNPDRFAANAQASSEIRAFFGRLTKVAQAALNPAGIYIVGLRQDHDKPWGDVLLEALARRHEGWVRHELERGDRERQAQEERERRKGIESHSRTVQRIGATPKDQWEVAQILTAARELMGLKADDELRNLMGIFVHYEDHFTGSVWRGMRRRMTAWKEQNGFDVVPAPETTVEEPAPESEPGPAEPGPTEPPADANVAERALFQRLGGVRIVVYGGDKEAEEVETLRKFFGLEELYWLGVSDKELKQVRSRLEQGQFDAFLIFQLETDHQLAKQLRSLARNGGVQYRSIKKGTGRRAIADKLRTLNLVPEDVPM